MKEEQDAYSFFPLFLLSFSITGKTAGKGKQKKEFLSRAFFFLVLLVLLSSFYRDEFIVREERKKNLYSHHDCSIIIETRICCHRTFTLFFDFSYFNVFIFFRFSRFKQQQQ